MRRSTYRHRRNACFTLADHRRDDRRRLRFKNRCRRRTCSHPLIAFRSKWPWYISRGPFLWRCAAASRHAPKHREAGRVKSQRRRKSSTIRTFSRTAPLRPPNAASRTRSSRSRRIRVTPRCKNAHRAQAGNPTFPDEMILVSLNDAAARILACSSRAAPSRSMYDRHPPTTLTKRRNWHVNASSSPDAARRAHCSSDTVNTRRSSCRVARSAASRRQQRRIIVWRCSTTPYAALRRSLAEALLARHHPPKHHRSRTVVCMAHARHMLCRCASRPTAYPRSRRIARVAAARAAWRAVWCCRARNRRTKFPPHAPKTRRSRRRGPRARAWDVA